MMAIIDCWLIIAGMFIALYGIAFSYGVNNKLIWFVVFVVLNSLLIIVEKLTL